jgi:hypothetical protein
VSRYTHILSIKSLRSCMWCTPLKLWQPIYCLWTFPRRLSFQKVKFFTAFLVSPSPDYIQSDPFFLRDRSHRSESLPHLCNISISAVVYFWSNFNNNSSSIVLSLLLQWLALLVDIHTIIINTDFWLILLNRSERETPIRSLVPLSDYALLDSPRWDTFRAKNCAYKCCRNW